MNKMTKIRNKNNQNRKTTRTRVNNNQKKLNQKRDNEIHVQRSNTLEQNTFLRHRIVNTYQNDEKTCRFTRWSTT